MCHPNPMIIFLLNFLTFLKKALYSIKDFLFARGFQFLAFNLKRYRRNHIYNLLYTKRHEKQFAVTEKEQESVAELNDSSFSYICERFHFLNDDANVTLPGKWVLPFLGDWQILFKKSRSFNEDLLGFRF